MDSLMTAAARSLARGDPLGALQRIALRSDPPALALRGIAMAQLGDLSKATELLRRAARAFGAGEPVSRARCVVAQAEVAFAARELTFDLEALRDAIDVLENHGDATNAVHGRVLLARHALLMGQVNRATEVLGSLDVSQAPAALRAQFHLLTADIALRRVRTREARAAFDLARDAARPSDIPALLSEIAESARALERTAARAIVTGVESPLRLPDVEALLGSRDLVVDACRRAVRKGDLTVSLTTRPVLFALARALGEHAPGDVPRDDLVARAFGVRRSNDTHRARLRVEIGRLRKCLSSLARVDATPRGYALVAHDGSRVVVLAPPIDGEGAELLALLTDGEAWSTSALALALGASQRTVQRALASLEEAGQVRSLGRARARRWVSAPAVGFTTTLLLPGLPPPG